jgi:alpha-ketoglutaric semialdehyde dehydrogenase
MHEVIKPSDVYQAWNPVTGAALPGAFQHATYSDVHGTMTAAHEAFKRVQMVPSIVRAELLERIARSLSEEKFAIVERAAQETGLCPQTRLGGELDRTCSVLRIFSEALRRGNVQDVRISTADPARQPKPRADVRRMRVGIGPVVVIEASNFPLAFGVIGGDAASAMAAGCPVIAKVHPFHPGTSELVGAVVTKAVRESGLPPGFFSLVHGGPAETLELVKHPFTRGIGFTGSRSAGQAIRLAANERLRPLDELSLEMGSLNPVFLLPKALAARGIELARGLNDAILIGGGQFCTKPGHVFVPEGPEGDVFLELLVAEFRKAASPILLSTHLSSRYELGCKALERTPGVSVIARGESAGQGAASVQPTLFLVSADTFLTESLLREEVFGPMSLIIRAPARQLALIAAQYQGELTATVHGTVQEYQSIAELSEQLSFRVGRLLFQGFSPGVELCDGVNHGGPWPSALGRSTVVGTTSYERWLRPVCFQDAPYELLPLELRADNPLNLCRRVNERQEVPNSEA